jgi:hypothetical protein
MGRIGDRSGIRDMVRGYGGCGKGQHRILLLTGDFFSERYVHAHRPNL